MIKRRIIGIILILIGIGIVLISSQLRNRYGDVYIDLGTEFIAFPFAISFSIFIILVLTGIGLIIFPIIEKKIKSMVKNFKIFWKGNKNLVILVFFGISAVISILIILYPSADKIIQSELVVVLICITLYYAFQTQMLVEQEKKSLEEEKKIRNANFGEKRLKGFYYPVLLELNELEKHMEKPDIDYDPLRKSVRSIADMFMKGFHLSTIDAKKIVTELNEILLSVHEDINKGELKKKTIKVILAKIDEISLFLKEEMIEIDVNIEKTYEFFSG